MVRLLVLTVALALAFATAAAAPKVVTKNVTASASTRRRRRLTEDEPVGACATEGEFERKIAPVNANCCSGAGADCSSGVPTTCSARCAAVLPTFFRKCRAYLDDHGLSDVVGSAAALCDGVQLPMSRVRASSVTDERSGCPPAADPGSTLIEHSFVLKEPSVVIVSAQMIRNTNGRADLHLMLDEHRVDGAMTWTSAGTWEDAEARWVGVVGRGTHTVWLESDEGSVW
eukprot:SAG22_NODE_2615_length_2375_cov_10.619947_2_plen_229_part_00